MEKAILLFLVLIDRQQSIITVSYLTNSTNIKHTHLFGGYRVINTHWNLHMCRETIYKEHICDLVLKLKCNCVNKPLSNIWR